MTPTNVTPEAPANGGLVAYDTWESVQRAISECVQCRALSPALCADHMWQRHRVVHPITAAEAAQSNPEQKPMPTVLVNMSNGHKTTKATVKRGALAAFVRQFPLDVPVDTIVARAKERGLPLKPSNVHQTRIGMRQAAKAKQAARTSAKATPATKATAPAPKTKAVGAEAELKRLVWRIGYDRAAELIRSWAGELLE